MFEDLFAASRSTQRGLFQMAPTPGQRQQRPRLGEFRKNTRQRFAPVGTISLLSSGGLGFSSSGTILLPQVGLLSGVLLWVDAQINDSNAAPNEAAATFGPFNLLKRVQVVTNLGTASIVDCSGYGLYVVNRGMTRDAIFSALNQAADYTGGPAITNDPMFQYPVSGYAQNVPRNVRFVLYVPIAANWQRNFGMGLINLQAPEIRVNVNVVTGGPADLYAGSTIGTNGTISGGSGVNVGYFYYEVPPPSRRVALPPLIVHRLLEDRAPFAATGDQFAGPTQVIPRQGKLLRLFHTISANGAMLTGSGPAGAANNASVVGVDAMRIVYNFTDTVYNFNPPIYKRIQDRLQYGHFALPAGSYAYEFWGADANPGMGDFRDVIDTEAISTIQSILTVDSGVTLGTGNNFIDTVREIVQGFSVQAAGGQ